MASVSLSGVHKRFGDTHVVRGVDLDIADGEFLVLVGSSGCGKSTLLRMLAGLEQPSSGSIAIGGRVVNDVAPRDRDIAMVFQSYALYPHMTVRENMGFGLKVRGAAAPEIDAAVADAARVLDIVHLLDRKPKEMSGGQRQRVAMGRALVRKPKVFLFDEPLSNLDASLRGQMRVELKRLHAKLGVTTVYVTHDQVEAMTLADRIALLDKGVVQQVGTPAELYDWPANRFTARFLGSPGMNFVEAELRDGRVFAPGVDVPVVAELLAEGTTDGPVWIGVRPHDLRLEVGGAAGAIEAEVDVLEPMGWETHAHLRVGDARWTARFDAADAASLTPRGRVRCSVAPRSARLFARDDERALYRAPGPT
ncbi:MAG: sn-glycerol-3-phosphate ABC transporter ATP-binding protein UgpC [Myxococcales bacterium]|nr:sn-glycerol-3-phosphate ABC transporter ATP-binding protein UgpC [Myxococcales bacterium]MCB9520576.1 sn-glycerol-3-phosphate ABC transporter ATP-binding protein UgpC [Myxococcales bacterium]MCB9531499.1 sn-glycerol-3-phosphate ABC transporter ATP-binding protein UgpC [Myxococcales bacterium]